MRIYSILAFFICFLNCMADEYMDFRDYYRDVRGVVLSFPEQQTTPLPDKNKHIVFVKDRDDHTTGNCFMGGAVVRFSNDFLLFVADQTDEDRVDPRYEDKRMLLPENHRPYGEGLLHTNMNLPPFYDYHNILENTEDKKERKAIIKRQRMNSKLRRKYVRVMHDNELTQRVGCDFIDIVRLPNLKQVVCSRCDDLHESLHSIPKNINRCYIVNFCRLDRYRPMAFMVFCNSNKGKSLDDYVEQISHYVRFDPDFKLE